MPSLLLSEHHCLCWIGRIYSETLIVIQRLGFCYCALGIKVQDRLWLWICCTGWCALCQRTGWPPHFTSLRKPIIDRRTSWDGHLMARAKASTVYPVEWLVQVQLNNRVGLRKILSRDRWRQNVTWPNEQSLSFLHRKPFFCRNILTLLLCSRSSLFLPRFSVWVDGAFWR